MAKSVLGPRVFRRTAPEINAKIEEYIAGFGDDYTVSVYLNKAEEDTPIDDFVEKAIRNTHVEIRLTKDGEERPARQEFYTVVEAPSQSASARDPVLGGIADSIKQLNEQQKNSTQTIADLHRTIQEGVKGQLAMAKAMRKLLKAAAKATSRSLKDRKKAEEQLGPAGVVLGLVKEINDAMGPEATKEILFEGFGLARELFGSLRQGNHNPGSGSEKAVPEAPTGGGDPGGNDTA